MLFHLAAASACAMLAYFTLEILGESTTDDIGCGVLLAAVLLVWALVAGACYLVATAR